MPALHAPATPGLRRRPLEAAPRWTSELLAASLDYAFDYGRMTDEILGVADFFVDTPPYQWQVTKGLSGEIPFRSASRRNYGRIDLYGSSGVERRMLRGAKIFYLRNSTSNDVLRDSRFAVNKKLPHDSWFWRPEVAERIPYTIECIEALPYRRIGLVRAFVCEDTFMPTHRDTAPDAEGRYDRERAVGISLIPSTGGVGMLIWDEARRKVHDVKGQCLIFDDSKWHGVPMTRGTRITLRIFGELDFNRLQKHFVHVLRN